MSPIIVLVGVGVLALSAVAIFTRIIIGIHKGDKNLYSAPRSNSDAFARRLLGGVRYYPETTDGDDK